MKRNLLLALLCASAAHAATVGVWNPTSDPGSDGWDIVTSGSAGTFSGDPASNGTGAPSPLPNPAWGFWSNGGFSSGTWSLDGGSLTVGQSVTVGFDNGGVTEGSVVTLGFGDAGTTGFAWQFFGGGANYSILDSLGISDTGQGWTSEGMFVTFTLTGPGTYDLEVSGAVNYTTSGTLASGLTSIDEVIFSNNNTSGGGFNDAFVGGITVVPEPGAAVLGCLGALLLLRRRK